MKFNCKVCGKEVTRQPGEMRKNKGGRVYCSRNCRNIDWQGEGNPNFANHWTAELKETQSVKLKDTFTNGRKVWNKGIDKSIDPRLAKCGMPGNDFGKYTKGQKRPDNIWRNVLNSAGLKYGLQKIHEYKYHAEFWLRLREAILERDNHTCQECGATDCRLEVHHKIPARMNGKDEPDNLVTLCSICHKRVEESARKRAALVWD